MDVTGRSLSSPKALQLQDVTGTGQYHQPKRYSYSITVLKNKKTSLPTTMLGRVSTNQEVAIHERGRMQ